MSEPTEAAVLVPVFRDPAGVLRLVLVVRGAGGLHGGQLALPGGRVEPSDRSFLDAALREAQEEVGLGREQAEILAELDPLETRTSGFVVHPFLARIRPPARWRLAQGEIVAVVTPPISAFAAAGARAVHELRLADWPEPRRVEGVTLETGELVWGLTLRLLDALVPRVLAGEWRL